MLDREQQEDAMLSRDVVKVGAKSAAARLVDNETAEVRFLTEDNKSLRVMLPQEALFILARRIADLADPSRPD